MPLADADFVPFTTFRDMVSARGLSLSEAARRLGLSRQTPAAWARSGRVRLKYAERIEAILPVEVERDVVTSALDLAIRSLQALERARFLIEAAYGVAPGGQRALAEFDHLVRETERSRNQVVIAARRLRASATPIRTEDASA